MARNVIKTNFAGGEFTPALSGRVDWAKYPTGAAVMRNFFVDFRGGASTRPGTKHVGATRIVAGDPKPRIIPFVFSTEQAYVLEMNGSRMRVIYQGAYVTETAKPITAVSLGALTVLTIAAHGYLFGEFVTVNGCSGAARANGISGLNGRTFRVEAATLNTITIAAPGVLGGPDYVPVDSTGWAAWTGGGTTARIYDIATPWAASALFALNFAQSADVLTVVHPDYPAYDVRRLGHAQWEIVQEVYGATTVAPNISGASAVNNDAADPQYFFAYAVTTLDVTGRESNPSSTVTIINRALDQISQPNVVNKITWPAVSGAYKYRIYKANPVPSGQQGGGPYVFGLVGNAFEPSFVDANYAPEFDQGPPQVRNPFLVKTVAAATITSAGQGYVAPYLVITDATGSGAAVALASDLSSTAAPYGKLASAAVITNGTDYSAPTAVVLDAAPPGTGLVLAFSGDWIPNPFGAGFVPLPGSITIANGGSNYHAGTYTGIVLATAGAQVGTNVLPINITSVVGGVVQTISWSEGAVTPVLADGLSSLGPGDTLTFAVGADTAGTGATVALTLLAVSATNNPACTAYLEQRRVFAGSHVNPAAFWVSRPGQFTNFDVSDPTQDDDAISAALYAQEVNLITALVQVTSGLMVLTSAGAYLLTSGANDAPLTPSSIRAPTQSFSGAQALSPLRIDDRVLYATARGSAVRDLAFNFYSNNFTGNDISVLSSHLLEGRRITQWAYAEEPSKIVWAVRDDGVLLSLTYLREQEVFGWARHDTAGEFVSVCSIPEGRENAVYVVVRRYLEDYGYRYHVERMAARDFGANPAAGIAPQPEKAWCVDDGAEYPLTQPAAALLYGTTTGIGKIYSVSVDAPGSGYTSAATATITDVSGAGAVIALTVLAGQITGATIVSGGSGYVAPTVTVLDGANGSGAVITARPVVEVLLTFDAALFSAGDIGKVCRLRGGKGVVLSVPATNQLVVDFFHQMPVGLPNIPGIVLPRVEIGDWSLTATVSLIGGLDHLNGATVQVLADGSVQTPKLVQDGCIALDAAATAIIVGQGFTAQLQTLRLEVAQPTSQGQRKTIPDAHLRMKDTRGLAAGPSWDAMTEIKEREDEAMGQPARFAAGGGLPLTEAYVGAPVAPRPLWYSDRYVILSGAWSEDGVVCIQQSYPLPATVLALIPAVLLGDNAK